MLQEAVDHHRNRKYSIGTYLNADDVTNRIVDAIRRQGRSNCFIHTLVDTSQLLP